MFLVFIVLLNSAVEGLPQSGFINLKIQYANADLAFKIWFVRLDSQLPKFSIYSNSCWVAMIKELQTCTKWSMSVQFSLRDIYGWYLVWLSTCRLVDFKNALYLCHCVLCWAVRAFIVDWVSFIHTSLIHQDVPTIFVSDMNLIILIEKKYFYGKNVMMAQLKLGSFHFIPSFHHLSIIPSSNFPLRIVHIHCATFIIWRVKTTCQR